MLSTRGLPQGLGCAVAVTVLATLAVACGSSDSGARSNAEGGRDAGGSADGGTGSRPPGTGGTGGTLTLGAGGVPVVGAPVRLSGRVMAPSGAFPISGALVFLTKGDPEPIPSGVYNYECDEMDGTPYALSKADGTWTIDAPPGTWRLVTRKGNFRRIVEIEVTPDMEPSIAEEMTTLPATRTPDGADTIPSFAVVKTEPDLTYNLLAKFGMGEVDSWGELVEGTETFDIYEDSALGSYPHTSALFDDPSVLHGYHMIFLPCSASDVGVSFVNEHVDMLRDYVAAGGRIYNSCTVSLWSEATFPDYIDFYESDTPVTFDIGRRTNSAYTTTGTVLDSGLAAWMGVVSGADPNSVPFENGYVTIDGIQEVNDGHGLEKDDFAVKPYVWLKDNGAYPDSPLMVTYNYDYGKVFYSVYETSHDSVAITPQEYVLLYVILEVGVCSNPPPEVR